MKKTTIILCFLVCICWVGVIILNGAENGKMSQVKSMKITTIIKNTGVVDSKSPIVRACFGNITANSAVRKMGHFSEYFILAICLSLFISKFKNNTMNKIITVLFICLFIAVLDEFIQRYTPNRTSSVMDILIDFSGSIVGTCVFYVLYIIRKKIRLLNKRDYHID